MRAERAEILDVFRMWHDHRSWVRCEGRFAAYAFSLRGRIAELDEDKLRFVAEDTQGELVLKLTPEMQFAYLEARHLQSGADSDHESCVAVFFGPLPKAGEPESIVLAEIKSDPGGGSAFA